MNGAPILRNRFDGHDRAIRSSPRVPAARFGLEAVPLAVDLSPVFLFNSPSIF
jgi:hypothetical protein